MVNTLMGDGWRTPHVVELINIVGAIKAGVKRLTGM
jgi:hypothetical protein